MMSRLPALQFRGEGITVDRSFQYGPIYIDRSSRGSDLFPQLFGLMRSSFASRFPIGDKSSQSLLPIESYHVGLGLMLVNPIVELHRKSIATVNEVQGLKSPHVGSPDMSTVNC